MTSMACSCVLILVAGSASATTIFSNFGPGDSYRNAVHDVLNLTSYLEHATRFTVPLGTNFSFAGIDLPLSDSLANSQVLVSLWTNAAGKPGSVLESLLIGDIPLSPNPAILHGESASNTILLQGSTYWISVAATPGSRVGWFVNNTDVGGYALKDPSRGISWLVIDAAGAGAVRVLGQATAIPEPSTALLLALGLIGLTRCRAAKGASG